MTAAEEVVKPVPIDVCPHSPCGPGQLRAARRQTITLFMENIALRAIGPFDGRTSLSRLPRSSRSGGAIADVPKLSQSHLAIDGRIAKEASQDAR